MAEKVLGAKPKEGNNRYLIALIIFIVVMLGGWVWYVFINGSLTIYDAYVDRDKVSISSKMLGKIARIYVQEGDKSRTGRCS